MSTWCYLLAGFFFIFSVIMLIVEGDGSAQSAMSIAFWALARTYLVERRE